MIYKKITKNEFYTPILKINIIKNSINLYSISFIDDILPWSEKYDTFSKTNSMIPRLVNIPINGESMYNIYKNINYDI